MPTTQVSKAKAKDKAKRRLYKVRVDEVSLVESPAVGASRFLIAKRDAAAGEADDDLLETVTKEGEQMADDEHKVDGQETVSETPEPKEPEPVVLEKGAEGWMKAIKVLQSFAGEMAPDGLEVLAQVMRYTLYKYGEDEKLRAELSKSGVDVEALEAEQFQLEKAMKVIGPSAFAKIESAAGSIIEAATGIQGIAKSAKEIKKSEDGETPPVESEQKAETGGATEQPAGQQAELAKEQATETPKTEPEPEQDFLAVAEAILKGREEKQEADLYSQVMTRLDSIAARLDNVDQRQTAFSEGLQLARGKV